ncbi:serine hydrolase domain-containing protein [Rubrivivax rivuli]|uniref:Beta-lactamase n=1 Tax=Rubrivivax rivuli TaxID=1862385 RepID=A0A437RS27_9BURK|nr:serine hydrolase domain-containing protein [Rubrivivax rivuli]RVU49550.1 class A beta-lactamase-related serine hydrolase [Rubrivivax rivuli]
MRDSRSWALLVLLLGSMTAMAQTNTLEQVLQQRLEGDRTGACIVAATIEDGTVQRARFCARATSPPALDAAFEIGSISKTMLGLLVADLVEQGRWRLDDPIARHLPAGTVLPRQGERQITVADLLTHSAGLPAVPALMQAPNPEDPYATLTEAQLLDSLARVQLSGPIGSRSSYSNFGAMVLSLAVARAHGGDFETALRERVLLPLKMPGAWVARAPAGQPRATGHQASGRPNAPWTFPPNLAGVGGVKATLDDMVAYAQALLRPEATPLRAVIARSLQPLAHRHGYFWLLGRANGRAAPGHEGGTGGFSSLLIVQPAPADGSAPGRAVVLLADTALTDLGGLGDVAAALLGARPAPQRPRRAVELAAELRAALVGEYQLQPGVRMRLHEAPGGRLMASVPGQDDFELRADDRGDLYPLVTTALATPQRDPQGQVLRLLWRQGGGVIDMPRVGVARTATAPNPAWAPWAGHYELMPGFVLRIFESDGRLMGQATGQGAFELTPTGTEQAEAPAFGVQITFVRDAAGQVSGLVFRQGGQTIQARKQQPGQPG